MFKSNSFFIGFFLICCIAPHQKVQSQDNADPQTPITQESDESAFAGLVIPMPALKYPSSGNFSLGLRSTASLFNSDGGFGSGVGGQFRLQLSERINTEWFADLITTNLSNAGRRTDAHIGWSVMFYLSPNPTPRFKPYVLAGHCFDYTKISAFSTPFENRENISDERWSSAVQMGFGTHLNLTQRFDFSLSAQYMLHLGNDIHAHIEEDGGYPTLEIEEHDGTSAEGHLLITLSVNYKIADLWQRRF